MTELKNLKIKLEMKITELTNYVEDVNKKNSAINTSTVTSCAKIDQQVKNICEAVTRKGCEFKLYLQNARQKEERKLKRIVESSENFIDELEESVHNINTILKGDSMYDALDGLLTMRSQWEDDEARELIKLYDVSSEFHSGEIDTSTLDQMIGQLEITQSKKLTHTFNCSEVNQDSSFSPVYKVEDRSWHFKAYQYYPPRSYKCYLNLGMVVYGEDLVSNKIKVTMEFINNTYKGQPVVVVPLPRNTSLATEFIWETGYRMDELASVGVLDDEYGDQFTVQATIVVTDMKT
ncbi:hypothetical protein SNE40_016177 [Patella caerulea]